jgi:hypothetical protein
LNGADEAVAGALQRLDERLGVVGIANGAAHFHNAARDHRLGDEFGVPHLLQQLVAADHPIAVLNQISQHAEHARFEALQYAVNEQLVRLEVQFAASETDCRWLLSAFDHRNRGRGAAWNEGRCAWGLKRGGVARDGGFSTIRRCRSPAVTMRVTLRGGLDR